MRSRLGFKLPFYIQLEAIVQNAALIEDLEHDPSLLYQLQYSDDERIIDFTQNQTNAVLKCPASAGFFTDSPPQLPGGVYERRRKRQTPEPSRICEPNETWRKLNLAISLTGSIVQIVQVFIKGV